MRELSLLFKRATIHDCGNNSLLESLDYILSFWSQTMFDPQTTLILSHQEIHKGLQAILLAATAMFIPETCLAT